MSSRIFYRMM